MKTSLRTRISHLSRDLSFFIIASFSVGMAGSLVDSTLNNFLNDSFSLSGFQRSFLELPREFPGFIVVFVSAIFWFLGSRKMGALALLFGCVGSLVLGFTSNSYYLMVLFLFILSMGQHLFIPVSTTIGMELAKDGRIGHRLGQLNAIRNLAVIVGSGLVFVGYKYLGFEYKTTFIIAAIVYAFGMVVMTFIKPSKLEKIDPRSFLKLHKEYTLYYVMSVLYGSRKQIFFTFAPWVIVSIYGKPTQTIATLVVIGGVIGILFQPLLGKAIDKLGEKKVLAAEAVLLVFVCLAYATAKSIFPENVAFIVTCVCYLLDQVSMSVNMARSTYMKKIALKETDIQPALSASITIDHFFSIGIALLGGTIWKIFGFQFVFLFGVLIAILNFFATMRMKVPDQPRPTVFEGILPSANK